MSSVRSWQIDWNGEATSSPVPGGGERRSGGRAFRAKLSGFSEVPPVLTAGRGAFRARIVDDGPALAFELTYSNLSAPTTAAHIHFGPPGVNGEVIAFLCGGDGKGECPTEGTVSGRITAEDIRGIPSQGLAAGDLEGALRIIRSGNAYVNVHTTAFPAGEIRGPIR